MSENSNVLKNDQPESSSERWRWKTVKRTTLIFLFIGYFCWAVKYQVFDLHTDVASSLCNGFGLLLLIYGAVVLYLTYIHVIKPIFKALLAHLYLEPLTEFLNRLRSYSFLIYVFFFIAVAIFLIKDTENDRYRLIPAGGLLIFIALAVTCSESKNDINWRIVLNGLVLEISIALLVIQWKPGDAILRCLGTKVTEFLNFGENGTAFVYGRKLVFEQGVFAFKSLGTVYFVNFVINILYYYGIMQKFVSVAGAVFRSILGVAMCDSVCGASNILFGPIEAVMMVAPFLERLTESELFTMMSCSFATTAAPIWAAFTSLGVNASDIILSSVMTSPWAVCYSKILMPETQESDFTKDKVQVTTIPYESVLDAATAGAINATKLILGVIAGIIAFLSFMYFINGCTIWLGQLVGFSTPENSWNINILAGKLFVPFALLMGTPLEDCTKIGELIGLKTITNELVAFQRMSTMNLKPKSKTLATFALCGFSNPSTMGVVMSIYSQLIPSRKGKISTMALRAAAAGGISNIITACLVSLFIPTNTI